jgi:hypothetical protein
MHICDVIFLLQKSDDPKMDNKNSDIAVQVESSAATGSKEVEVNIITALYQLPSSWRGDCLFCKCNLDW